MRGFTMIHIFLAMIVCGLAQQQQLPGVGQGPPRIPVRPPVAYAHQADLYPSGFQDAKVFGVVSIDTAGQSLTIDWRFTENGARHSKDQAFGLDYWPTAAAQVNGALMVAGKRRSTGNTVIERWSYTMQSLPSTQLPVFTTETVYDAADPARGPVRFLSACFGDSSTKGKVLVHFRAPNQLWTLGLDAGTWSQLFPTDQIQLLDAPDWNYVWVGETQQHVYVYVYARDEHAVRTVPQNLVLLDLNRDGAIDEHHGYSDAEWLQALGTASSWIRVVK